MGYKISNRLGGSAVVIVITACLLFPSLASAEVDFPYGHMSVDKCMVTHGEWSENSPVFNNLKLPRAIKHANKPHSNKNSACKNEISFSSKVKEITMEESLVIEVQQAGTFRLRGGCEEEGSTGHCSKFCHDDPANAGIFCGTVLNAAEVDNPVDGCIVKIVGDTKGVVIRDISIENAPAGSTALCIEGKDNLLVHVGINGGENGIVMGEGSVGNIVMADSWIRNLTGIGIAFNNPGDTANNLILASEGAIGATDDYGLALIASDADRLVIDQVADPTKWIVSKSPYQIRIIAKDPIYDVAGAETPTHVDIEGYVIKSEDASPTNCPDKSSGALQAIQIYSVGGKSSTGDVSSGHLMGYVGKAIDFGLDADAGTFLIRLPTADYSRVIFVPEIVDGGVGQPTPLITVNGSQDEVNCPDVSIGDTLGGDKNPGGGSLVMTSLQHCCAVRGIKSMMCGTGNGGKMAKGYDTDGDNIPDDVEDSDRDCICDGNETCFKEIDSDFDGLADSVSDGVYKEAISMYSDNDGLPNALDPDSDGDGLLDGQEDHNSHFTISAGTQAVKGVLYRFKSFQNKQPIKDMTDPTGKPLSCTLGADNKVGVRYLWYMLTCKEGDATCASFAANPVLAGDWGSMEPQEGTTQRPEQLVCKNQSLGYWKNFNGIFDKDNFETDPYHWDSDKDSFCDGDGSDAGCGFENCSADASTGVVICDDPLAANLGTDNCRTVNDPTNLCASVQECYAEEIFYGVQYNYVNWDPTDGTPVGLLDADGNQVPDAFEVEGMNRQKIQEICPGDMDQDGIPDCVEQPFANCATQGGPVEGDSSTQGLKYYRADSDGDTLKDYEDVCPESYGKSDNFEVGKAKYSCEPFKDVYANEETRKVLALFIDRDGDNLKDGEEDRDFNGIGFDGFDNNGGKSITYDVLMAIETNPLNPDSDGDGLNDYQEVSTSASLNDAGQPVYTNPRNSNTDGDGLADKDEDRDGDGKFSLSNKNMMGSEGCADAMGNDTDPTDIDTDDDTLEDGIEIKGDLVVGQVFIDAIGNEDVWSMLGGVDSISNPLSADSDNDGLKDAEEYNDFIKFEGSNPCMRDSDNDSIDDVDELSGCRLNPSPTCVGGEDYVGKDTDSDGLSDICESKFIDPASGASLDANNQDSDGDGVKDGDEDINHNCIYEPNLNETNPFEQDTDSDGLNDGFELKYGTDPVNPDTDGDCLWDGMEDKNKNGQYDMGSETNALSVDTDNDALPDGYTAATGLGEDINCNGNRDSDGKGNYTETDPVNPDSDNDGNSDGQEIGGNMANLSTALNREGCMSIADTASAGPSSMYYLFAMLVMATKIAARRIRRKTGRTPA